MRKVLSVIIGLGFFIVVDAQPVTNSNTSGSELYDRAKAYVTGGDLSNAILVYNQALQLEPRSLLYRRELAFAYFLQGDMIHAAQVIYPLMGSKDADPETFILASKIFRKANRLNDAADAIRSGIKKFPLQGMLYEEYGQVLLGKNKNKEAVGAWEKGINKDPGYYLNYYNLARAYYSNREYIWAILTGEQFVNMEGFSVRTEEIKTIIFESYKSLIAELNSEELKKAQVSNARPKNVEEAFRSLMKELKSLVTGGMNMENLGMLRLRFIVAWNKDYARRYPLELFDYQQRLILNDCYDSYNVWLFGKADNEQKMKVWIEEHKEVMNKFDEFIRIHKLQPKPNQNYHN